MKFYTAFNQERPIRLSEATRVFAYESEHGKYGDDTVSTPCIAMDDVSGFAQMTEQEKYNAAIMKLAKEAPIRICESESVSGAATLGMALQHVVPVTYNGMPILSSISHLTVDFQTVVFKGVDYLESKISARLSDCITDSQRIELEGMKNVVDALRIYHARYMERLAAVKPENAENLRNVPFLPATNFKEAVQSIWFTFSFIRLCGNWPGIGRLDEMLGEFLKNDIDNGVITIDEAREFLAGMFIKGCEWIQSDTPRGSGDAQHYQNIVLAGIDKNGNEVTNEATYLILDIVEELAISDFPITVRINENTPEKLLDRVAEVMRHGGGIVAVYNETLIINSLVKFGYSETEARCFANDGCWEVQIPGKTCFGYVPFDSLQLLLNDTLRLNTDEPACFDDFESLYNAFLLTLERKVDEIYNNHVASRVVHDGCNGWKWPPFIPTSVISLFEDGSVESASSYFCGGPTYTVTSPHIGGAPDVGNSLYAIDRLVFTEKKVAFAELMQILKNDWEGNEDIRRYVSDKYTYYGNDDDIADSYTVRVLNDFSKIVEKYDKLTPIRFPAGVSTFGRQIEWSPMRQAVPFGRKKGEILAGNTSPTPDTDFEGATAVIRSYCKADLIRQTCGAALDVKLHPSSVTGKNGIEAIKGLIRGFINLNGYFMQLDIVDADVLLDAVAHPEKHKTLSVRVSGWNARFVTLNESWQRMIIERSTQKSI